MDETESDEVLVERVQRSARDDTRDFERLVERYQDAVSANCRYMTGSEADTPDLTQEVFVKAYFGLAGFDGRARFGTWIRRIKVNHCLNWLRGRRKLAFTDLDAAEAAGERGFSVDARAESGVAALDERSRTRAVLDAMSDSLRVPLLMRDLDGYSYQEIAAALGIGLSAAKMRIKRAREQFRAMYGEREA